MLRLLLLQGLLALLMLGLSHRLIADELLIVVAKDATVKQINKRQLERIFRRKTLINDNSQRWVPINLALENPLRLAFSNKIFNQPPKAMESFWNVQYFKGISPPYVVASEEAVLRFIASTPGAIGYINTCHLDSRVRILLKLTVRVDLKNLCHSPK